MSETQADKNLEPKKPTTPTEPTTPKAPRKRRTPKKEKDVIPNMELALIAMFFLSFIIWTVSKCTVKQAKYEEEATSTETAIVKKDSVATATSQAKAAQATKARAAKAAALQKSKTVIKEVTKLYVVLDQLKLRKGPTRDSAIVYQFKLNDKVTFLEQVTTFKEKINIGNRIADEPWVKVRGPGGHEGWVYGAGVSYYRPVVSEPPIVDDE